MEQRQSSVSEKETGRGLATWSTEEIERFQLASDVQYSKLVAVAHPLRETIYQIEWNRKSGFIDWLPISSRGKVDRLETVGNMVSEFVSADNRPIIAAINGDFFSYTGTPSGLQMVDQEIITSPLKTKALLAQLQSGGHVFRENVEMKAKLDTKDGEEPLMLDAINRPRDARRQDVAVLYNWRFGQSTRSLEGGTGVVIRTGSEGDFRDRLTAGNVLKGAVESIGPSSDLPIERGFLVLTAYGTKAEWIRRHLKAGMEVTLSIQYEGLQDSSQVISANSTLGMMLLRDGKINESILDFSQSQNLDRHPRTIAASNGEKLVFLVIDGRQPGHSDGMSLAECASYLQSIGMRDAMNLDGGGSSTCYARRPGERQPELLNNPSDGFERGIGNAVLIVNNAPKGELHRFIVSPCGTALRIVAGSKIKLSAKGVDSNWHPAEVDPQRIQWEVRGDIGELDSSGVFTASRHASKGTIIVRGDHLTETVHVEVMDAISELSLQAERPIVEPGGETRLIFKAKDENDKELYCSGEALTWLVEDGLGTVTDTGRFTAGSRPSVCKVTVQYGQTKADCSIQIGKPPQIIADFESIDRIKPVSLNAVADSVQIAKAARPRPVRFGTFSARLGYDFTGTIGLSRAGMQFWNEEGRPGVQIEGIPMRLSLWVYGNGQKHWLRAMIRDAFNQIIYLNLTEKDGLDWTDWKYVYTDLPQHIAYPIRVEAVLAVETNDANKISGELYFDRFQAEYTNLNEDVTGPVFSDLNPAPDGRVQGEHLVISAVVKDEGSGVDPSTIKMWVDQTPAIPDFDASTGKIVWRAREGLPAGKHQVVLKAKDKAGNPSVPAAEWTFETY
jgi:hypothetical protein